MNSVKDPILYLDLQPKNLLICGENIRIIDFDHAQYASNASSFTERYGTTGFAAPEQYGSEPMDCRTDVYAIGALIWFMCTGSPPGSDTDRAGSDERYWPSLKRILLGALAEKKEDRYKSAGELGDALEEFLSGLAVSSGSETQTIVFAGSRPGIGTTHASLAFASFLASEGYNVLYREEHDSGSIRSLASNMGLFADYKGEYRIKNLNLRPYYPQSVKFEQRYYPITVLDAGSFGSDSFRLPDAGLFVLLCAGKWWETQESLKAVREIVSGGHTGDDTVLLFNHMSEKFKIRLPEDLRDLSILFLPHFPDPFKLSNEAEACFRELLSIGTERGALCGFEKKRRKFPRKK